MLLVLIPSAFEAKDFLARLEGRRAVRLAGVECATGQIAGREILVALIGMGPPHAARRAGAVIGEFRIQNSECRIESKRDKKNPKPETRNPKLVHGVILAGFAGALKPGLQRGEVFLTAGAGHLAPHLPEAERPPEAALHTAAAVVATAAAKAELRAHTGAWLVDMEQAEVAAVVAQAGLPFVGLRIVSDEAQEDLPHELLSRAYDQAEGEYTPLKLAGHLTRNPFKVRQLASFVRPLPPIRKRLAERLHTWLTVAGPGLFPGPPP